MWENNEARMIGMTKPEIRKQERHLFLAFELCHYFVIRLPRGSCAKAGQSSFVI